MTITAAPSVTFQGQDSRTVGITANQILKVNDTNSFSFADGTGARSANLLYQNTLALSSGTLNVDLSGTLTDQYGTTIVAARIKAIKVKNLSSSNALTVGNGTNPWVTMLTGTGTIILPPGAVFFAATPDATGWAVTAATGDILKFAGTGTDTFTLMFLAANA